VREWVERRCTTTGSTLTRRCAPASPWQGEASLCCFVGNSRQRSVRSLHRANPAGGQCRGDPVGRPAGPWWAGTRDEVARRQDPPSPGAARRPLPARERRLFVASLETAGSVLSAHSTEQTLLAGNVGATRWVARRGRGGQVGLSGAGVHDPARATHRRVAPTCRVQRCALHQRTSQHAGVHVVGAVREMPLQRPVMSMVQTRRCAPTSMRWFSGAQRRRAPTISPFSPSPAPLAPPPRSCPAGRHLPLVAPLPKPRSSCRGFINPK